MNRKFLVAGAAALCLAFTGSQATAWSEDIHALIGLQAYKLLKPATKAKVDKLIAAENLNPYPGCEVTDLGTAARFPDCVKRVSLVNPVTGEHTKPYASTKPLHYQDALFCQPFKVEEECTNGKCISAALTKYTAILNDKTKPDVERLLALKFVAHLVGDAHQPLHATDNHDVGGNNVHISVGGSLHSYWDEAAPSAGLKAVSATHDRADGLEQAVLASSAGGPVTDFEGWLKESHLAGTTAYKTLKPAPICGAPDTNTHTVDADYEKWATKTARERTADAAKRLAALLEATL